MRWATAALLAISALLLVQPAQCQQAHAPSSSAASRASGVTGPGQFYDSSIDLHFDFPIEMQVQDMSTRLDAGHKAVFGFSADEDPAHQEMKRCMRPLLDADLPADKAPHRAASLAPLWVPDKEEQQTQPIYAELLMMEFDRDCVRKEAHTKNENAILSSIAAGLSIGPGMRPITKPLWYELDKQKVHMNAGAGLASLRGGTVATPIVTMSMATEYKGHLIGWMFISNDTEIFNELTKSRVQFGTGAWSPMFAANIAPAGTGTPRKVLPK